MNESGSKTLAGSQLTHETSVQGGKRQAIHTCENLRLGPQPDAGEPEGGKDTGSLGAGLAIKNPHKKTHLKNPLKMFFVFFVFNFLFFYENNTNFSL
jgi:hypothetical protein